MSTVMAENKVPIKTALPRWAAGATHVHPSHRAGLARKRRFFASEGLAYAKQWQIRAYLVFTGKMSTQSDRIWSSLKK
jgi:hypothetical protein